MSEHFIPLSCINCGGKLDVYDDMERFACGYCGSEMIAKRRGGTISLSKIEYEIIKVREGTDKTAAELAIKRLKGEIAALGIEMNDTRRKHFVMVLIFFFIGVLTLTNGIISSSNVTLLFAVGILSIAGYFIKTYFLYNKAAKSELSSLNCKLYEQLRIANS